MKLIVAIPAYNEENTIDKVIKGIPKIKGIKTEVLVVDDGSRDNTAKVAKKAGANVISFAKNRGLVPAFKAGLRYCLKNEADIIVNLDGDMQHNPQDIQKLIKPLLENKADLVIGSRFLKHMPKSNSNIGNKAFSFLISLLVGKRITDAQSGFRAYTREVAEYLKIRRGYTYTQQMIIQAVYHKFKILEIPIMQGIRMGKSRLVKNPLSFAYNAGSLLISVLAVYYPLKFLGLIGLFLILLGAVFGLLFTSLNVLSALVIMIGFQSIFFGILFEILRRE